MFLFFNVLYEIILFQNCLIPFWGPIRYIDEVCILLLILMVIKSLFIRHRKKVLIKSEKKAIVLMIIFLIIGLLGNFIYKIQYNNIAIFKDIIAISKFMICYISALILSRNINKEYLLNKIQKRTVIYINIITICALMNIVMDIGMGADIRYGVRSFSFLFTHPTYLVSSVVIMLSVLIAANKNKVINKIAIFESIIILVLTFRNKAFMIIFAYIALKLYIKYYKKVKVRDIIPIIIVGLLITYNKITEYFSWGLTAARPALYIVGLELVKKYFPLGSGLGTFASSISGEYYSPLYYEYGISNVWGLTPEKYNYMADTFWPYIYGQYGVSGFIIFIFIIILIIKSLIYRYSDKNSLLAVMIIIVYILIASTAESIFTDVTGTFSFIVIATYLGKNNVMFKENSETKTKI